MTRYMLATAALASLATLAACGHQSDGDAPGSEQNAGAAANDIDPALGGALGNQIVVDPARAGAGQTAGGAATIAPAGSRCTFRPDKAWVRKLPAELALYPGARLDEAAGSDAPGCRRRIVSFASEARPAAILDYYRARVTKAGYSAEHLVEGGNDVLGGTRGEAAYYVSIAPVATGSSVDIIANTGG